MENGAGLSCQPSDAPAAITGPVGVDGLVATGDRCRSQKKMKTDLKDLKLRMLLFAGIVACRLGIAGDTNAVWMPMKLASAEPTWTFVSMPKEWPKQPDASNAIVRCVGAVEAEIIKAQRFLATGNYRIIQGGLKGIPPHILTRHPDNEGWEWEISFNPESLAIREIETRTVRRRIALDEKTQRTTIATFPDQVLICDSDGQPTRFAQRIRDQVWHEVRWSNDGRIAEEVIKDWANFWKPIRK